MLDRFSMAFFRRFVPGLVLSLALSLLACGGTAVTSVGDGSGGSRSPGSGASASAAGGQAAGGAGVGGSGVGGSGASLVASDDCEVDDDCVVILNGRDPCASAVCSEPIAVSREAAALDQCLVPWEDRFYGVPWYCHPETVECPAGCAEGSTCTRAYCASGTCRVTLECPSCDERLANFQSALAAAKVCDPTLSSVQCQSTETLIDECGCPVAVNQRDLAAVEAAQAARSAWIDHCAGLACPEILCPASGMGYCIDGSCSFGVD